MVQYVNGTSVKKDVG